MACAPKVPKLSKRKPTEFLLYETTNVDRTVPVIASSSYNARLSVIVKSTISLGVEQVSIFAKP